MENEKNEVKSCHPGKTLSIIAIVVSIISIAFSAFTLGFTLSKGKERDMRNEDCRMQMECPMRNTQGNQTFKQQFDRPAFESSGPSAKGQSSGNRQNNSNNQGRNNANNGFDFSNFD